MALRVEATSAKAVGAWKLGSKEISRQVSDALRVESERRAAMQAAALKSQGIQHQRAMEAAAEVSLKTAT
jgi:hypothetical protein